jgi:hypothetical protein
MQLEKNVQVFLCHYVRIEIYKMYGFNCAFVHFSLFQALKRKAKDFS